MEEKLFYSDAGLSSGRDLTHYCESLAADSFFEGYIYCSLERRAADIRHLIHA